MKTFERDVLLERQTVAVERQADELALPRREREHAERELEHPALRRLFGGERGAVALLRGIPGFAALWEQEVPNGYLLDARDRQGFVWRIVLCPCGNQVALRPGAIGDCECSRWFFNTGPTVRVKRFDAEAA